MGGNGLSMLDMLPFDTCRRLVGMTAARPFISGDGEVRFDASTGGRTDALVGET